MKERERQEKKEATMRENAAEPNAKRAARAESETWTCKICDKEKNRNQYSKYQGRKPEDGSSCVPHLSEDDRSLQGMRKA